MKYRDKRTLNERRLFLKTVPALATLPIGLVGHRLIAQQFNRGMGGGPDYSCPSCSGPDSTGSKIVSSHNTGMAGATQATLVNGRSAAQANTLSLHHIDNWNYCVANGLDKQFAGALSASQTSPSSACASNLATLYNSYGLQISAPAITASFTMSSSDASSAVSYANSVGLSAVMNAMYNRIQADAGGQPVQNCHPYAQIANVLQLLSILYGASAVVLGPVAALAAAGFGLASLGARAFDAC